MIIYVCYQINRLERDYPRIFFASPDYNNALYEMEEYMEIYNAQPVLNENVKNVWVSDTYRFEIVETISY